MTKSRILSHSSKPDSFNGFEMERTPSGERIILEPSYTPREDTHTFGDDVAAFEMVTHFRRRRSNIKDRILRNLIMNRESPPDDEDLMSLLAAADQVFFNNRLSGRVGWEWSNQDRYKHDLIGTTALRNAKRGGFETLIVLSWPLLRSGHHDHRLIISTFLHELIHCYLFICCGFRARNQAREEGGHTDGFHRIAQTIDDWVDEPGYLQLCNMKANLDHFRADRFQDYGDFIRQPHHHEGCNQSPRASTHGFMEENYLIRGTDPGWR